MTSVPVEVTIEGTIEQVFDLITQTRFWPQWHLLTRAVSGTTERPFLAGDTFNEFIRTSDGAREVPWTVLEHHRPNKVVIHSITGFTIAYNFSEVPNGTLFKRIVTLDPGTEQKVPVSHTEEQSVANLKALVEAIINTEHKGGPSFP